jgi:uncharacterized protein YodC (DUF2158 family)
MELEYTLKQLEDGVYFWADNAEPQNVGTIGPVERQEAERVVAKMNKKPHQPKWIVGQVVQLKPGGPPTMVVFKVFENAATCRWWRNDKLEKDYFPDATLQVPKEEKPPTPPAGKNPSKRKPKSPPA